MMVFIINLIGDYNVHEQLIPHIILFKVAFTNEKL